MNENTQGRFVIIERAMLENIIGTLRHVNVRDDDFDSMDRLVGCVGALTRAFLAPPMENVHIREEAPEEATAPAGTPAPEGTTGRKEKAK